MAAKQQLSIGLDSSTQSLTAVIIDLVNGEIVHSHSLDYAKDERLNGYGINHSDYIIPPREPGEADQPPLMFLASLDAMFADLKTAGIDLSSVVAINDSGQQHGHVYLKDQAPDLFGKLKQKDSGKSNLADILAGCFSYGTAPIWKTSNTTKQADDIRSGVGGKERMIRLSGSDSPLRFTGAVIRRVGEQFPRMYGSTMTVQLISSFVPAVLTGNADVPWDFGNGCGTSLMDYESKSWSDELLASAASGLPGGTDGLRSKLPDLISPDAFVGTIASYFTEKYGFSSDCVVAAGSGDNPQTKVLIEGDLLSLGTSFVNMVSTDGKTFDLDGYANGMYDGIGRPFMFGCRTNGAMVWDRVRMMHGLKKEDFAASDGTLSDSPPGTHLFIWQPDNESFPPSGTIEPTRIGYEKAELKADYPGVIESTLGLVYLYSQGFTRETADPMYVTGGVTKVPEIVRRVAGIWNRPIITIGTVGAALGAAVAGASALAKSRADAADIEALSASVLPRSNAVAPEEDDVRAFHGEDGYLRRLEREYKKLIS